MKNLIEDRPLLIYPKLAEEIGLNEAILLQQFHFHLRASKNEKEGFAWIYNTYEAWKEKFPFWSQDTIKRIIRRLEKSGYLISTTKYNRIKQDRTKWYRIDYEKFSTLQAASQVPAENEQQKMANDKPERTAEIYEIIAYLNEKTGKRYKPNTPNSKSLINARLAEGYTVEECKQVIDQKCMDWKNSETFSKYLRPATLFSAKNFENYVNEQTPQQTEQWKTAIACLMEANIQLDDRCAVTTVEIKAAARSIIRRRPEKQPIIFIDYLQIIRPADRNISLTQAVGQISMELKAMAKEFNCPVVVLSQLSRAVESRDNKWPMMSDLRDSGNIEQDADVILFLYRDDYYKRRKEPTHTLEIEVAKHRNGPTGNVSLVYRKETGNIYPMKERSS